MSRADVAGRRYQPFSNPFFDHASTYTPPTVKALFSFCRHYHLTMGIINAIDTKAAEYPVTDLIIKHSAKGVRSRWEELLLGILNYRMFQVETNMDVVVYGNAFVSPSYPFRKKLTCEHCNAEMDAIETRPNWRYINHKFWLTCPKCGQVGYAKSKDDYSPRFSELGLVRWNPEYVHVFTNESTGHVDYGLDISPDFRSQIQMGRKDLVATTPEIFLEAVRTKRSLVFDRSSVFHLRRATLGTTQWGTPMLMPVLKDAFYMQIMKKANEALLLTNLIPQIFLFPQPATADANPFVHISLDEWRNQLRRELARQRMDPAYYAIMPFPIGHQVIGGDARQLLIMPEIRALAEMIIVGMGFPPDLVFGQGSYSGNSVSMRILENFFLSMVHSQYRLLQWVVKQFAAFLGWPAPTTHFKPFKMADDLQRMALSFQLNSAGKISDTTLLSAMDLKVEEESDLQVSEVAYRQEAIKTQLLVKAEAEGEAQVVLTKFQATAQRAAAEAQARSSASSQNDPFAQMQASPTSQPPSLPMDAVIAALAEKVKTMEPARKALYLSQLQNQIPELESLIQQQMAAQAGMGGQMPPGQDQAQGGAGQEGQLDQPVDTAVDMTPMPEQRPPRRAGA